MRLADVIQGLIRRFGYELVRRPHNVTAPFSILEVLIRDALSESADFFFVQVGANDGVRVDPLRASILEHRLRGLLIEPIPGVFEDLRRNYAGLEGLQFENCAIAPTSGTARMYRIRPDAPLPDDVHALASFNRQNLTTAKQGVPGLDRYVEEIAVRTCTLQELLTKHGITKVSLLLVDTEGFDAAVVNMALDAGLAPRLIVYEHVHLRVDEQAATLGRLKGMGYRFLEIGMDTVALKSPTELPQLNGASD
jgi:FkbM family methyltransferase